VLKIMICEDDYGIRNTIKRLFIRVSEEKKISIELEESINGLECIYRIYKDYINGTKYDSVLLDENMPFMKGSNCMTILKNMYTEGSLNKIKIISISSFDDQETMKFIKLQGCDDFMPKPHTREVVSKFLDSLVT
jgi:CheY-like chemotaxis protein